MYLKIQRILMKKYTEERNGVFNEETDKPYREFKRKYPLMMLQATLMMFKD